MQDLRRQRQAIVALVWFAVIFFVGWIAVNVAQASYHGYGLINGQMIETEVGSRGGNGWFVDSVLLIAACAMCAILVGGWRWVGSRLFIGTEGNSTPAEVDEQPFYVIDIPRITRVLIGVGIACIVGVAIGGAVLFPLILIRYGW